MNKHKVGHNKYCHITHKGALYTFHNFRDFTWTVEDYTQQENWIDATYDITKLESADMIVAPFGPWNAVAHTMLVFHFANKKEITLSVEAQLDQGNEYSFLKATFRGYHNLFIRGSAHDHVGLRRVRGEHPLRYPLHLDQKKLEKMFLELVHKTNEVHRTHERYALLSNNCTSALWDVAKRFFPLPRWHWTVLFAPWLPYFLKKKGALKLTEKTRY